LSLGALRNCRSERASTLDGNGLSNDATGFGSCTDNDTTRPAQQIRDRLGGRGTLHVERHIWQGFPHRAYVILANRLTGTAFPK
jgi:hypothetical protein